MRHWTTLQLGNGAESGSFCSSGDGAGPVSPTQWRSRESWCPERKLKQMCRESKERKHMARKSELKKLPWFFNSFPASQFVVLPPLKPGIEKLIRLVNFSKSSGGIIGWVDHSKRCR